MSQIIVVGSINVDLVVRTENFPRCGETVVGSDLQTKPGGKGANQACAAARLGARTRMIARIGRDVYGDTALAALAAANVNTDGIQRSERATGAAVISVRHDGENTIVLAPGANATLDADTALAQMGDLRPDDCVLLQLEIPVDTVIAVARFAKAQGATVFLDPAPYKPLPDGLLRCIDFLTPNQTEAAALLGREKPIDATAWDELRSAARSLREQGPAVVLLKLGASGVFLSSAEYEGIVPGFSVQAADTTAAGDVFNAAFAVACMEGSTVQAAARFGNAAAALSVTRQGAQSSIPSRAETEAFLASQVSAGI